MNSMENKHKSSSHVQQQAEDVLFDKLKELLNVEVEKNPKILLSNQGFTYIRPDFYSAEHCVVGEIFAHIGKPKKAQDNKIANDILKMLLLEKVKGKQHRKIIVVCDDTEKRRWKANQLWRKAYVSLV